MKIENWNGHSIRFTEKAGEWWAVAKDVAEALGYRDAEKASRYLPQKYKDTLKECTPQCDTLKRGTTSEKNNVSKSRARDTQDMIIINEPGLYRLIMRSNKPEAEAFQDWVYAVLKHLREAADLKGFEVFRLLDKEHQKAAMDKLHDTAQEINPKLYIAANTIANKAVALQYGLDKMQKKEDMTPAMLTDRQNYLTMAVDLMAVREKYNLSFSVSDRVYETIKQANKSA